MQRLWLALLLGCFAMPAAAQMPGPGCGGGGVSPPCTVTTIPSAPTNSATLALSASAALNTATVNRGSLPATWGLFYADNPATSDIAVCAQGGTCTCLANGIAATNGVTVEAGVSRYPFDGRGAAIGTPTWVSCSGAAVNVGVEW